MAPRGRGARKVSEFVVATAALCVLATGCDVRSARKVGEKLARPVAGEYVGTWVERDGGIARDTMVVEAGWSDPNVLRIRNFSRTDSFELEVTGSPTRRYFDIRFEELDSGKTYVWGKLVKIGDTLEFWYPVADSFRSAVARGELAGRASSKADDTGIGRGSDPEVLLSDSSGRIVDWIEHRPDGDSSFHCPLRWTRLPAPSRSKAAHRHGKGKEK